MTQLKRLVQFSFVVLTVAGAVLAVPSFSSRSILKAEDSCADGILKKCRTSTYCSHVSNGVCDQWVTFTDYYTMF